MIAPLPSPVDRAGATPNMARSILAAAAEVEVAETKLKQVILESARRGDCASIIEVIEKWLASPPGEVLAAHST